MQLSQPFLMLHFDACHSWTSCVHSTLRALSIFVMKTTFTNDDVHTKRNNTSCKVLCAWRLQEWRAPMQGVRRSGNSWVTREFDWTDVSGNCLWVTWWNWLWYWYSLLDSMIEREYSITPIYRVPRFTVSPDLPGPISSPQNFSNEISQDEGSLDHVPKLVIIWTSHL
jgi:hypothetical protein